VDVRERGDSIVLIVSYTDEPCGGCKRGDSMVLIVSYTDEPCGGCKSERRFDGTRRI
jgi:hypothetical protein